MRTYHGIPDYKIDFSPAVATGHYDTSTMIPSMTSWTAPIPYTVRASGNWDSSNDTGGGRYAGWRACDGIKNARSGGSWYGYLQQEPAWLKVDLSTNGPSYIWKYEITCLGEVVDPSAWIVQGSNDDTTWTDLDSRSGHGTWTTYATETFTIAASPAVPQGPFRYYRVYITQSQEGPSSANRTQSMTEFNMYRYTPD